VTKRIMSVFLLVALILAGCGNINTDEGLPTQISIPTSAPTDAPTDAPTQTAVPTDVPLAIPTDLIIPRTSAENPNDQAFLRTIHTSPDLGIVDVYIESLAIATNLDFGRFTEREGIVAGRYTLRILPTGSFVTDVALYEETLTIFGGQSLIFVITGTIETVTVTTLNEPNAPLPNDTSRLLMINAIEGANNLVMLVDDAPQTSITPYLQISEITEHEAKRTDFMFQNNGNTLFDTQLDLRERRNYTFILLGNLNRPDTLDLLILNSDAPGLTDISFVNAAPSIGLVDVYFGDIPFIMGADYSEINIPQQFLSGTYDIRIYPEEANPNEVEPLTGTQFIANPDEEVVLVLVGEPSNLRFVQYRNNPQPTYDNRARITFINALETVPNILLRSTDENLDHRLSYARLSDTYDIDVEQGLSLTWINQLDDLQDTVLEDLSNYTPEAGQNYLYIFSGRGYDTPLLLSLNVGTLGFAYQEAIPVTHVPSSRPTQIRLVNMWKNRQFVVRLDGTVITEGVEFGKATNPLIISNGEHTITFHDSETDFSIVELTDEFQAGKNYSIVAYNFINTDEDVLLNADGDVLLIDDTDAIISSVSGGMRLIVLDAEPGSSFGIGYSAPTTNLSQPNAEEDYRRSLSLGIKQIIRKIAENNASEAPAIPIGTYNIRIIDNEEIAIAFTHTEYTIEPQTLYNVFLQEEALTGQTHTVIVPYSSP
jgi:hypothetical protein